MKQNFAVVLTRTDQALKNNNTKKMQIHKKCNEHNSVY